MGIIDNLISSITGSASRKVTSGVSGQISKRMKGPEKWQLINADDMAKKMKFTKEKNGSYTLSVESDYIGEIDAGKVKNLKEHSRIKAKGEVERYLMPMKHNKVYIFKNDKLKRLVAERFLDVLGIQ